MVGEHLIGSPCRYHLLFHCDMSCPGTRYNMQGTQCDITDVQATLGSASCSGAVNTMAACSVPVLVY